MCGKLSNAAAVSEVLWDVRAQPIRQGTELKNSCPIETANEGISGIGFRCDPLAVDCQKSISHSEGGAFVAIDKRMRFGPGFPKALQPLQSDRHKAGLGAIQGCFQQTPVPDAGLAAIALDLVSVDDKNLDDGQIVRHSASFL